MRSGHTGPYGGLLHLYLYTKCNKPSVKCQLSICESSYWCILYSSAGICGIYVRVNERE